MAELENLLLSKLLIGRDTQEFGPRLKARYCFLYFYKYVYSQI